MIDANEMSLAAGTGTSSRPFADAGALVVPADLSEGMLSVGKERQPDLAFVNADALALPFADAAFDSVTMPTIASPSKIGATNCRSSIGWTPAS